MPLLQRQHSLIRLARNCLGDVAGRQFHRRGRLAGLELDREAVGELEGIVHDRTSLGEGRAGRIGLLDQQVFLGEFATGSLVMPTAAGDNGAHLRTIRARLDGLPQHIVAIEPLLGDREVVHHARQVEALADLALRVALRLTIGLDDPEDADPDEGTDQE
ncbi:MAG: hypothetical protein RL492_573 [Verrucomicrobiota bacterium]